MNPGHSAYKSLATRTREIIRLAAHDSGRSQAEQIVHFLLIGMGALVDSQLEIGPALIGQRRAEQVVFDLVTALRTADDPGAAWLAITDTGRVDFYTTHPGSQKGLVLLDHRAPKTWQTIKGKYTCASVMARLRGRDGRGVDPEAE